MKKIILVLSLFVVFSGTVFVQAAPTANFDELAKDNPALAGELAEIYAVHPGWNGSMINDEAKMKWVLDNSEKYPMVSVIFLEYVDNNPGFAVWAWEHPVLEKKLIIYSSAHKKAAILAKNHPGMARWIVSHPKKAKWMAHHPVAAKKIIKHEIKKHGKK